MISDLNQLAKKISKEPFANFMGIRLLELREGYSRVVMKTKKCMLNFHGTTHGGVIFSLADAAFAAASNSHRIQAVALTMEINYRISVKSDAKLFAEAKEESLGRKTALYHVTVTNGKGELVASCHGTVYRKDNGQCRK